jgi:amidophosphoribosyltransferase
MHPCVYGIDFPDRTKLMAANNTTDEIRAYLNADSLHYLSTEGMVAATGQAPSAFCMACYDGHYPVPYDARLDKSIIERRRRQTQTLGEAAAKENEQFKLLKV